MSQGRIRSDFGDDLDMKSFGVGLCSANAFGYC